MTGIALRDAGPGDAPTLALVLGERCRQTQWMPKLHSRAQDLGFVRGLLASHVVRLGQAAGAPGFLARQGGEVSALYLVPAARGLGLGRALLDEAMAAQTWLGLWTFQANLGALRFYARQGFRETARTDGAGNEEGLPDVRLEWTR